MHITFKPLWFAINHFWLETKPCWFLQCCRHIQLCWFDGIVYKVVMWLAQRGWCLHFLIVMSMVGIQINEVASHPITYNTSCSWRILLWDVSLLFHCCFITLLMSTYRWLHWRQLKGGDILLSCITFIDWVCAVCACCVLCRLSFTTSMHCSWSIVINFHAHGPPVHVPGRTSWHECWKCSSDLPIRFWPHTIFFFSASWVAAIPVMGKKNWRQNMCMVLKIII